MTTSPRNLLVATALLATSLCAAAPAGAVTQSYCSFPTALTTWTLNGNAFEALSSEIRLTNVVANEAASAFLNTPVAITATTSFHAHYRVQMGPNATGGDGIAFILHNSAAGASAL